MTGVQLTRGVVYCEYALHRAAIHHAETRSWTAHHPAFLIMLADDRGRCRCCKGARFVSFLVVGINLLSLEGSWRLPASTAAVPIFLP